jgi:hypothetical protein
MRYENSLLYSISLQLTNRAGVNRSDRSGRVLNVELSRFYHSSSCMSAANGRWRSWREHERIFGTGEVRIRASIFYALDSLIEFSCKRR